MRRAVQAQERDPGCYEARVVGRFVLSTTTMHIVLVVFGISVVSIRNLSLR